MTLHYEQTVAELEAMPRSQSENDLITEQVLKSCKIKVIDHTAIGKSKDGQELFVYFGQSDGKHEGFPV